MDHIRVLQRAWRITWSYRALWFFGFLLALTTGNGGSSSSASRNSNNANNQGWQDMFPNGKFAWPHIPSNAINTFNEYLPLIIGLSFLALVLVIASSVLRYVSETSLIRMVDEEEKNGSKSSVKQGFRLGWSRQAFHLFLIDLLAGIAGLLVMLVPALIVGVPLLVWLSDNTALRVIGTVVAASLGLLFLFLLILFFIAVSLVILFARRICVLEKKSPIDSIKSSISMLRKHLGESVLMGLILFGIGILFTVLMIPVVILLVLAGSIFGGVPGLLTYGIADIFAGGDIPTMIGVLVGLPIFLLIVVVPAAFIGGIFETFKSSTWTLTYREFMALNGAGHSSITPITPVEPRRRRLKSNSNLRPCCRCRTYFPRLDGW